MKTLPLLLSLLLAAGTALAGPIGFKVGVQPTHLPSLVLWLRSDSVAAADGTAISTWSDFSGKGLDVTNAGTARPVIKLNIVNNRPVLRFAPASQQVLTSIRQQTFSGAVSFVAVVARPWNTLAFSPIWESNYGSVSGIGFFTTGGSFFNWVQGDGIWVGNGFQTGQNPEAIGGQLQSLANGKFVVLSGVLGIDTARAWTNSVRFTTRVEVLASLSSSTATVSIGGSPGSGDWSDWDIAELEIWGAELSDADRIAQEKRLDAIYQLY
jgi:hypothetical protein